MYSRTKISAHSVLVQKLAAAFYRKVLYFRRIVCGPIFSYTHCSCPINVIFPVLYTQSVKIFQHFVSSSWCSVCDLLRWLGCVKVRTLDLRSTGRRFDSQSGRYQVVTTRTSDCLQAAKPSRYITNHQCQLSLPSLQGSKSSTGLSD